MSSLGRNLRSLWLLPLLAFCLAIGARDAIAQETPDLVMTKVWEGEEPDFWAADVSPDGRYVTEIDWTTGDLALIDLETGELRHLTDKGSWLETVAWAETSAFSRDGRQIAYTWWNEEAAGYEIRVMNVDGSGVRTVLPSPGSEFYAMVHDWTEDGRILTALWREEDLFEIGLVSAEDGTVQVLTKWGTEKSPVFPSSLELSPDGRFVAYDPAPRSKMEKSDIFVLPVEGGEPVPLVKGPGKDLLLGWMPDGTGLLYHSDRGLTEGIWLQPVADGRPTGEAVLLEGGLHEVEPIAFAGGDFFYGINTKMSQVHTAEIDLMANRVVTPPAPVEDPRMGASRRHMWSPDGRYLSYERGRGPSAFELVIRSTVDDETRTLDPPLETGRLPLGWSPDGDYLFVMSEALDREERGLFRIDVVSGAAEAVVLDEEMKGEPRNFELSSDATTLFYSWMDEESAKADPYRRGPSAVTARDLKGGQEAEIVDVKGLWAMSASPRGDRLAFVTQDWDTRTTALSVVSTSDGEVREIFRAEPPIAVEGNVLEWTPDGEHLLFATWNEDADETTLWKIAAAGGQQVRFSGMPSEMAFRRLRLSPDGTRIAFWVAESAGEIWKIENLPGTARVTAVTP